MSQITEHDTEEEWEGNNSEDSWVYFAIVREAVSVDNVLEWLGEIIISEVGGWLNARVNQLSDLRTHDIAVLLKLSDDIEHFHFIAHWNPAQA